MNCQHVRTAIDTTSRRESLAELVKSHLGGCGDCRSYADETSALLALLSAQPRVEAPPDFNFKLRARIARAQAAPRSPMAVLEDFWARTFSWSQAAAAVAAMAIVAALSAYYFIGSKQATEAPLVAQTQPAVQPPAAPTIGAISSAPENQAPRDLAAVIKSPTVRAMAKPARISAPPLTPALAATPSRQVQVALSDDTMRFYNRVKQQVMTASSKGYVYGAEDAGLSKSASFVPSL